MTLGCLLLWTLPCIVSDAIKFYSSSWSRGSILEDDGSPTYKPSHKKHSETIGWLEMSRNTKYHTENLSWALFPFLHCIKKNDKSNEAKTQQMRNEMHRTEHKWKKHKAITKYYTKPRFMLKSTGLNIGEWIQSGFKRETENTTKLTMRHNGLKAESDYA